MPAISRWIARQSTTSVVPPIPDSRCGAVPPEDRRHAYRIAGHLAGGYERELARRASFAALYDIGDRRFQLQVATSRSSPPPLRRTEGRRRPRINQSGRAKRDRVEARGRWLWPERWERCSSSAEPSGIAPGAKVGLASPVPARCDVVDLPAVPATPRRLAMTAR